MVNLNVFKNYANPSVTLATVLIASFKKTKMVNDFYLMNMFLAFLLCASVLTNHFRE